MDPPSIAFGVHRLEDGDGELGRKVQVRRNREVCLTYWHGGGFGVWGAGFRVWGLGRRV